MFNSANHKGKSPTSSFSLTSNKQSSFWVERQTGICPEIPHEFIDSSSTMHLGVIVKLLFHEIGFVRDGDILFCLG